MTGRDDERAPEGSMLRAWQDAGYALESLSSAVKLAALDAAIAVVESPRRLAAFLTGTSPEAERAMRRAARYVAPPSPNEVVLTLTANLEPLRRGLLEASRAFARFGETLQRAFASFDCSAFSVAVARRAEWEARRARWLAWRDDVQDAIDASPRSAVRVLMREVHAARAFERNRLALEANTAALRRLGGLR